MTRFWPVLKPKVVHFSIAFLFTLPITLYCEQNSQALTVSMGEPWHGSLIDAASFPPQLHGYHLRDETRSFTTPEVIGALLDAFDRVDEKYPSSCDVFLGDFSRERGGFLNHHRSHQNGRDVDMGLFQKGNLPLDTFVHMNAENLDVAKTWTLVESLLASQRVERIFMDRSIQGLLYHYALSQGVDPNYLDRLFLNAGSGDKDFRECIIQHVPGHVDHMHVRFYAPWSTLAGQINRSDSQKRMMIELAQQAYLPKKVNYYVNGNEPGVASLAKSFGVRAGDLCRWNGLQSGEALRPGSCLVFYKRGFEVEPVHLARSLQPHHIIEAAPVQVAALPSKSVVDAMEPVQKVQQPRNIPEPSIIEKHPASTDVAIVPRHHTPAPPVAVNKPSSYTVRRGDTLAKVAKEAGISVELLTQLNGLKKNSSIRAGQTLKIVRFDEHPKALPEPPFKHTLSQKLKAQDHNDAVASKPQNSKHGAVTAKAGDTKQVKPPRVHTIRHGETLWDLAQKYQVSPQALCKLNGLSAKSTLKAGMEVKLPAK